jgi:hypothetical protein
MKIQKVFKSSVASAGNAIVIIEKLKVPLFFVIRQG